MSKLRKLEEVTDADLKSLGFNGYKTNRIYTVKKVVNTSSLEIVLEKKTLDQVYIKEWQQSQGALELFKEAIAGGYSLGLYDSDEHLLGFGIMSYSQWNNTLWIENFRISENHQRKGYGLKLMKGLEDIARKKGVRLIGLETQSTNYAAIEFYKSYGFEISGIDFARYPQRANDRYQVAVLMNKNF